MFAHWVQREKNLVAVDMFPRESRVFDKSTVEHHPKVDYEHISMIKTKPTSLSGLDEGL